MKENNSILDLNNRIPFFESKFRTIDLMFRNIRGIMKSTAKS